MSKFADWPIKDVPVTSLDLDSRNPRIPSKDTSTNQRLLIAELINHDKVYELAKEIADNGFFPLENLIGLEEDERSIILEGNRRLAALKLLISPELAPEAFQAKFRKLSTKINLNDIKKVSVLFAPSREAAAPLIMQKHTLPQISKWVPLMQARFFRELAKEGLPIESMARQYGVSQTDIARFLRIDTMYEIACEMDLSDEDKKKVTDPRTFPSAVLERLLDVAMVREFLGISFDEQGTLTGAIEAEEFKKAYSRIISDIAQKEVNTRSANTVDDVIKYINGLDPVAPDRSKSGTFTADDLKSKKEPDSDTTETQPSKKKKATTTHPSASLIPSGFKCHSANTKINEVFKELKDLKVDRYPNASAALLRILLELTMGEYLTNTTKIDDLKAKKRDKKPISYPKWKEILCAILDDQNPEIDSSTRSILSGLNLNPNVSALDDAISAYLGNKNDAKNQNAEKNSNWYPSWKQMLEAILGEKALKIDPLARKVLSKLASDPDYAYLDGVIHNRYVTAEARVLRSFAEAILEMVAKLYGDSARNPPTDTKTKGK